MPGGTPRADDEPARDPWLRPFTSTSIWNMPIGSEAQYVAANLPVTKHHALEHSYLMQTSADDPLRPIVRTGGWRDRCSGTERSGRSLHLPDGWMPRPVTDRATPNNPGVFLQPDGRTLYNLGAMGRCSATSPLYAQWPADEQHITDLYGDGRFGAHGASKLSQLGGAIRPGELTGDDPIRHALDLLVWSEHLYWGGSRPSSYRWPASGSDSYAGPERYRGTNPALRMGSLLALPPEVTPEQLSIDTEVGRKLFEALQDYGAYITDDSAWNATYLGVDSTAIGTFPWGDAERDDMAAMVAALHVVANNGPDAVGGGGTPRRPLLPALEPPGGPEVPDDDAPRSAPPPSDLVAWNDVLAADGFRGDDEHPRLADGAWPTWTTFGGTWERRGGEARAAGAGPVVAVVDTGHADVHLSTSITLSEGRAAAGVAFRVRDAEEMLLVSLVRRSGRDAVSLYAIREGHYERLGEVVDAGLRPGRTYTLAVRANGAEISVEVDHALVVRHELGEDDERLFGDNTAHGLRSSLTDRTDDGASSWDSIVIRRAN